MDDLRKAGKSLQGAAGKALDAADNFVENEFQGMDQDMAGPGSPVENMVHVFQDRNRRGVKVWRVTRNGVEDVQSPFSTKREAVNRGGRLADAMRPAELEIEYASGGIDRRRTFD